MAQFGRMDVVLTIETAVLSAICAIAAIGAAMFLSPRRAHPAATAPGPGDPGGPVLLFDATGLADASTDLRGLLAPDSDDPAPAPDWARLHDRLVATYPDLPRAPDTLGDGERRVIRARDDLLAGDILVERIGDYALWDTIWLDAALYP